MSLIEILRALIDEIERQSGTLPIEIILGRATIKHLQVEARLSLVHTPRPEDVLTTFDGIRVTVSEDIYHIEIK